MKNVDSSDGSFVLITGGAGFIGTNLASRLARDGRDVVVFDNLSRPGVERNAEWLMREHGKRIRLVAGDVRDYMALRKAIRGASAVYHFAAQVAVTASMIDPIADFEVNARGTLNLLEALRSLTAPPPLVFTSTNKVFGGLEKLDLLEKETRFEPVDSRIGTHGIAEDWDIEFCSPYGCSKGAADQYVLDYARTFGLKSVVLRMGCIYGPHQFGTEDQGWVTHFMRQALARKPIIFYGNGKQVRDALFVEDLLEALLLAEQKARSLAGLAFAMGGGPGNSISLRELVERIGAMLGRQPQVQHREWRASEQRYCVSDTRKFSELTGWAPRVPLDQGLERLKDWLAQAAYGPIGMLPLQGGTEDGLLPRSA